MHAPAPPSPSRSRTGSALGLFAILLLGVNLRPPMAAIGPLLDAIVAATGMSQTEASLLTTLPVLAMGVCALRGRSLRAHLGERGGVFLGAGLLLGANLFRALPWGASGLIGTAILAGAGIALVQILLPAFIKRRFPRQSGRVMGLYTTAIMAGSAIGAAAAAPCANAIGWPAALALWAIPAALAAIAWAPASAMDPVPQTSASAQPRPPAFWRSRRAWELLIFFGIGTGAYTLVLAWLPPFYTGLGWSPTEAGFLLGGLTATEVIAGLTVSTVIGRFPDRRGPILVVLALQLAGLLALVVAPLPLALTACILLGLGIGSVFPLSLIVTLDHLDDPVQAGDLAAFVQGGGYLIASLLPLLAGFLRDRFSDLSQAWIVMAVATLALMGLACRFSPRARTDRL